jgi:cytochrome c
VSKLEALSPTAAEPDVSRGAQVFEKCSACHAATGEAHTVGPSLAGIVGRPAAAFSSYIYSDALATAGREGLVWTKEFLESYVASPARFLPGNTMPFVGLTDASERRDLIGYLATLPAPQTASWLGPDVAAPQP